jgi:integration host factor subunit beta
MIKSELILKIAEQNPHLYEQDAADIVNVILDTVADALAQGGRVELRGSGVFTAKRRGARAGRNPRSGAAVAVSERVYPMFKTSREMLRRLNPGEVVE